MEELSVPEYLEFMEQLVDGHIFELDFEPFNASFPCLFMSKSIRDGVQFLNRHLSSKLFQDKESLYPSLNFLKDHDHKGTVTRLLPDAIGTTCSQWLEKVIGTEQTDILRVPFRSEKGILREWISPQMEYRTERPSELNTSHEFIFFFFLFFLSFFFFAAGCCKRNYEGNAGQRYHFSCQLTADLIVMNHTDFTS